MTTEQDAAAVESLLCSRNMLPQALVARAGVILQAAATSLQLPVAGVHQTLTHPVQVSASAASRHEPFCYALPIMLGWRWGNPADRRADGRQQVSAGELAAEPLYRGYAQSR